jgi:hypothetical protein
MNDPANELTMVSELRAEVQEPDNARLAASRALLISKTAKLERTRAIRIARPAFMVPALAVTAAAAVAFTYALSPGNASPPARQIAPGRSTTRASVTQAQLAARVLNAASDVVSRAPVPAEPGAGQWIYTKTVSYGYPGLVAPSGKTTDSEWITFDGSKSAYYLNVNSGPLIVHDRTSTASTAGLSALAAFNASPSPKTAYDAIASLPRDPRALLDAVAEAAGNSQAGRPIGGGAPTTKGQLEFDYLGALLWNAAGGVGASAAAEAAAYRAMATIPGVSVQQGITDEAGDPAIGVSDDGGYSQILLDPVSYQVIGQRDVSDGTALISPSRSSQSRAVIGEARKLRAVSRAAYVQYLHQLVAQHLAAVVLVPPGTVTSSSAYVKVSEVSAPGVS